MVGAGKDSMVGIQPRFAPGFVSTLKTIRSAATYSCDYLFALVTAVPAVTPKVSTPIKGEICLIM